MYRRHLIMIANSSQAEWFILRDRCSVDNSMWSHQMLQMLFSVARLLQAAVISSLVGHKPPRAARRSCFAIASLLHLTKRPPYFTQGSFLEAARRSINLWYPHYAFKKVLLAGFTIRNSPFQTFPRAATMPMWAGLLLQAQWTIFCWFSLCTEYQSKLTVG